MSELFVLDAETRGARGKGASRRLRRENKVPAILYGGKGEAVSLVLSHSELMRQLDHEAFYSHILTINVDGKSESVIVKDIQRHPYKPSVLHLDLLRVMADQLIRVQVPIHFLNEATSVGVKMGGQVTHNMSELEIECLPKDLPEYIEVDIGDIELGESFHLSSVVLPEGVNMVATVDEEHDLPVASIHAKAREEEEIEVEGEPGEEVEGEPEKEDDED